MKRHRAERSCIQCGTIFEGNRLTLFCSEACGITWRAAQKDEGRRKRQASLNAKQRLGVRRSESAPIVRSLKAQRAKAGEMRCAVCQWVPPPPIAIRRGLDLLHAHHVVPLACGGSNGQENLVILCPNHHALAHRVGQQNGSRWYGAPTPSDLIAELTALERDPEQWLRLRAQRLKHLVERDEDAIG